VRSASFADEVLVVDSGSTDRTRDRATAAGARVIEQPWLGWSRQRNHGARAAQHDWVFFLEADEIPNDTLRASIETALAAPMSPDDGYTVMRRDEFLGELMPNEAPRRKRRTFVRMYNRTRSYYDLDQAVHEEVRFAGRPLFLSGYLVHWRAPSLDDLVGIANRYATAESEMFDAAGKRARFADLLLRPPARFLWCYVWKGGATKGSRGLLWAGMRAFAEYARWGKLWERQHQPERRVNPPPRVTRGRAVGRRRRSARR